MNNLMKEMKRSLRELDLGLKGELTISSDMEDLSNSLFFDQVPASWTKRAYDSLNGLSAWYADMLLRIKELEGWTSDFNLPASVWLPGFFNPQSFLTAIMQSTARKNELPLDKMCLVCDVTKKMTRCSHLQSTSSLLSSSPPPSSLSPSSCPHHLQQSSMTIRHLHLADLCPAVSFSM